jgi:hypothetical protein
MKSASFLLAAALFSPVALLLGLGAAATFSLAVIAGLIAIALADYGHASIDSASATHLAYHRSTSAERLPLAA